MINKKHWMGLAALVTLALPMAAVADSYADGRFMQADTPAMQVARQQNARRLRSNKYYNYGPSVPMVAPSGSRQVQFAPTAMEVGGLSATASSAGSDYLREVCKEGTFVWPAERFPLKVYIEDGQGVPGYRSNFSSFVVEAFDTWDKVTNHKLSWSQVSNPQAADITIRWTDAVTERTEGTEAGRTAAVTRLNPMTGLGTISGAKMLFLTRLPQRQFSDDEVRKTCLHEVGHALGLQGHSSNRNDIMYYAVSPTQGQLTARDVATMNKLYDTYPQGATQVTLGPKTKP